MRQRRIPGADLATSAIALGTNRFGSLVAAEAAFELMDEYVALGGTTLDTAHIYADWIPSAPHSASEKTIGQWLRSTGGRSQLVVATKGGHPDLATPHVSRLSLADLRHDVGESLEFLGVDQIDLYWLHRDDPAIPVGEILEAVDDLARGKLIRYYGCSNWRGERIRAAQDYAAGHELQGFVANQPQWSLAVPNTAALSDPARLVVLDPAEREYHRTTGMAVLPWSPQGQGFFEKLDQLGLEGLTEKDRRGYASEDNIARYLRVKELAVRHGVSSTEVALAYLICQPFVTIPIIGARTVEQLRQCVRSTELLLSPQELAYLEGGSEV